MFAGAFFNFLKYSEKQSQTEGGSPEPRPNTPLRIGREEYRKAAEEHLASASKCNTYGDYVTCHYLSGLAVECIFRAYGPEIDTSWDAKNILPKLYEDSKFDQLVSDNAKQEMSSSLRVIMNRWADDHRYACSRSLEKYLNDRSAPFDTKGDLLKTNSKEMYSAAAFIVGLGMMKWPR